MDRYQRRLTPQSRHAYLAGRFHLLQLLAGYAGISSKEVELGYSRLSKPFLTPNPDSLNFNFSDTTLNDRPFGLFAFAKGVELGVDIEALNRTAQFSAIAAKRFSEKELEYVTDKNGEIDPGRFLSIWTRKEAYGKATGMGINFKMREIDLYQEGGLILNFVDSQQHAFRLQQIQIREEFISCVVHTGHQPLRIKAFSLPNQAP
jgi:4'-phosphopantetheinyl transferase